LVGLGLSGFSQKNITLNLMPYVGSQALTLNTNYTSHQGKTTQMARGSYYLSDVKIIHDGAQVLDLSQDIYLLVHAGTTAYSLGTHNVTNVEGIQFSVGVDSQPNNNPNDPSSNVTNNADPTLWPNGHPLNLQNPSMHWGWASGYMFAFLAGSVDTDNDQVVDKYFEIAPVGSQFFTPITVNAAGVNNMSNVDVNVYVNYDAWVNGILLENVGVSHGSGTPPTDLMNNTVPMNVFSASAPVGVKEYDLSSAFTVSPNPFTTSTNIAYELGAFDNVSVEAYDVTGKLVESKQNINTSGRIEFAPEATGSYIYNFLSDGKVIHTEKLIKK
jgi:hypothetical protein